MAGAWRDRGGPWELLKISLEARFHPDVLKVRWDVYARTGIGNLPTRSPRG